MDNNTFVNTSRIVGQGYSQAGTFWGVLNVSLPAYGAQRGLEDTHFSSDTFFRHSHEAHMRKCTFLVTDTFCVTHRGFQ